MTGGAICGGYVFEARRVFHCPTCDRRRRFYGTFAHWYGWTWTCLACGDRWQDGERGERPFMRGWRAESMARARKGWAGVQGDARTQRRAFEAGLRAYFEGASA